LPAAFSVDAECLKIQLVWWVLQLVPKLQQQ
jgi:hypothetical protein